MNQFGILSGRFGPHHEMISWDVWCSDGKSQHIKDKGNRQILAGDKVQVLWPDGSASIETLSVQESVKTSRRDNGFGDWWTEEFFHRLAFFIYEFRGIKHHVYLRHNDENRLKFKQVDG